MKIIPIALKNHIAGRVKSLSMCWLITRTDGVVQGFTDAMADLTVSGQLYKAVTGFEPSAIESTSQMAVDNMEINGLFNSSAVTPSDVYAGIYSDARIAAFYVNRLSPADGVMSMKRGYIGQISWELGKFVVEVRGVMQPFSQNIVELCSETCRASLGDARCKVGMAQYTVTGTVATVAGNRVLTDTARLEPDGYFRYGVLKFTSGSNSGLAMEVKSFTNKTIELLLPLSRPISPGDTYTMTAGCDRTAPTCNDRFNNILNFRGEPYVPDPTVTSMPGKS